MKDFDGRILSSRQQVQAALDAMLADRNAMRIGETIGEDLSQATLPVVAIKIGITPNGYLAQCDICEAWCEYPKTVTSAQMLDSMDAHMRMAHRLRGRAAALERIPPS